MELFRIKRDIPFMRHALVFNAVSLLTFLAAVFFLATRGLHLSIEFTGGTLVEARYAQAADIGKARHAIEGLNYGEVQVQNFGTSQDVLVRVPLRGDGKQQEVVSKVFGAMCAAEGGAVRQEQFVDNKGETLTRPACRTPQGQEPVQFKRSELVGPQVGSELARDGALALLATVAGIVLYLAIRFEWKYAVSAIIANLHDVVIILGFFAFFGWEFSLAVLAGVLAVLGYSVNESVVIFDRIRETFRKQRLMSPREVIDHAITTTTSRTIITHGATQMMVLAMLFFGGQTLHYFAMALTIGICFGIYSSVFVAAAIAMWLGIRREDLIPSAPKAAEDGEDPNSGAVV